MQDTAARSQLVNGRDRPRSVIIAACIIGMMFSSSAVFFSTIGLFIKPIAADFGWGRTQLASAASAAALASALATPLLGRLIDAYGSRRIILISAILLSAAIAALSFLPAMFPVYIVLALVVGVAGTGSTTFAYLSIMPAWFSRRLGLGLAFATIGFGLGQTLGPLYGAALIRLLGWREAYAALGLSILVVAVPNAIFLLQDRPRRAAQLDTAVEASSGLSSAEALKTPVFWMLAGSIGLITMAVTGCTVHLVPLLTDRGLSTSSAASAAALFGASMLFTRFATGLLLDYVNAKLLGALIFAGVGLGISLILGGLPGLPMLVGVGLLGAGLGVEADLIPYVTCQVFGRRSYATIYGFLFAAFNIGVVVGPLLMGMSYDRLGSYSAGLTILLVLALAACALLFIGLSLARSSYAVSEHRIEEGRAPPAPISA